MQLPALRQMPSSIWKLLSKSLRYLRSSRHPHAFLLRNVLDEILQRFGPTRSADNAAMKTDCHHLDIPSKV